MNVLVQEFLINVIHLLINEFDYLLVREVHVMIVLLLVASNKLDGTKSIEKKTVIHAFI